MKKELDEQLCKDFPLLYADRCAPMNQSAMFWGFEVGDGWEPIMRRLSEKLEAMIAALPDIVCECWDAKEMHPMGGACTRIVKAEDVKWLDSSITEDRLCGCKQYKSYRPRASQVKEKFGGLRVYLTSSTDEMEQAIRQAEEESFKTCEICGEPGALRRGGWLATLCDAHSEGRKSYENEEEE